MSDELQTSLDQFNNSPPRVMLKNNNNNSNSVLKFLFFLRWNTRYFFNLSDKTFWSNLTIYVLSRYQIQSLMNLLVIFAWAVTPRMSLSITALWNSWTPIKLSNRSVEKPSKFCLWEHMSREMLLQFDSLIGVIDGCAAGDSSAPIGCFPSSGAESCKCQSGSAVRRQRNSFYWSGVRLSGWSDGLIYTLPFKGLGSPRQFCVFHENSHFYLSNELNIS